MNKNNRLKDSFENAIQKGWLVFPTIFLSSSVFSFFNMPETFDAGEKLSASIATGLLTTVDSSILGGVFAVGAYTYPLITNMSKGKLVRLSFYGGTLLAGIFNASGIESSTHDAIKHINTKEKIENTIQDNKIGGFYELKPSDSHLIAT